MEETTKNTLFGLSIDQEATSILKTASSWARILAVCGFIFGGLMVIIGIITKISLSAYDKGGYGYNDRSITNTLSMGGTVALLMYMIIGALLIVSSLFVMRFASRTSLAIRANDQAALNSALGSIRNHFSLWAIVLIILLLLIVLSLLSIGLS